MITPTDFQKRVLAIPGDLDVVLPGGRNSAKTWAAFMRGIQYLTMYPKTDGLMFRKTYPSLRQPFTKFLDLAAGLQVPIIPNLSDMIVKFGNGSTLTFAPLPDRAYFEERFRGQSYQWLFGDELATYIEGFSLIDLLTSNLRHPTYPTHQVFASNPGPGALHLKKRFMIPASSHAQGAPVVCPETGRVFVLLHSTLDMNPHAGADAEANIRAAAAGNTALFEQGRYGLFDAVEGSAFTITHQNLCRWPKFDPNDFPYLRLLIGADWGSVAPWAAIWLAKFTESARGPDNILREAGTVCAFHETHNADPGVGFVKALYTSTSADFAAAIASDSEYLGFRPPVIKIDTQAFARGGTENVSHVAAELQRYGLRVQPTVKGKVVDSVQRIREMLNNNTLLIDERCEYLRTALANAPMDSKNPESIDHRYPLKHGLDGLAYGLNSTVSGEFTTVPITHGPGAFANLRDALEQRKRFGLAHAAGKNFTTTKVSRK